MTLAAARSPVLDVDVEVVAGDWLAAAADVELVCAEAAEAAVLAELGDRPLALEIGVRLTDDGEQRGLNASYRGKDSPTNVLAFPQFEGSPSIPDAGPAALLGDVVLAFETVRRESEEQGKEFASHLRHLIVHGVLHLLGHDHIDEDEAAVMEALEVRVLASFGVADPYADRAGFGKEGWREP